jgi:hypothetical protein
MARSKNKPTKNVATAGKTEVIVGPGSAPVAADASAVPTFTKIGMAGMIGLLGSDATVAVADAAVAEPPTDVAEPQAVADASVAEPPTDVAEPQAVADAAVAEEPTNQKEEAIAPPTAPVEAPVGFLGYLRNFFSGFGQAIHR